MKISYNWLKELLPLTIPAEELAGHLLLLGFEVEELKAVGPAFNGVVVAQVLSVQKHPNADRLNLCEVDDGGKKLQIVCGASNVAAGQRVPLARIGAKLPGGLEITRAKIRGVESEGMICSTTELGLPKNGGPEKGIYVLAPDAPLGADFSELLGGGDTVLEVNITPNRPDCLSHLGLARELSIYFDLPLKEPAAEMPPVTGIPGVGVEVLDSGCTRYLGKAFSGLTVGPSPAWLAKRLEAVGLRPINNIVDISNYVLLETGQPLHAFDLDRLEGGKIQVRAARSGEKLTALDGKEYALTSEDLVIADAAKPAAIAGVMGGLASGITGNTTRALLEIAHFAPGRVRRTSRRLGLRTDASYRYERGTDPASLAKIAARATSLILKVCPQAQAGPMSDSNPASKPRPAIEVSAGRINGILGSEYPAEKIEGVLGRLAARVEGSSGALRLTPPSYRLDLESPWDLAEEVGRHLGYSSIAYSAAPVTLPKPETSPAVRAAEHLRGVFRALGFFEAYNYDFVSAAELRRFGLAPESPELARPFNPISEDWATLRPNLLIGLLKNAQLNFNRGASGLRLFELGKSYSVRGTRVAESSQAMGLIAGPFPGAHWKGSGSEPDLYDAKGALEAACRGLAFEWKAVVDDGGAFHPKAYMELHLNGAAVGSAGLLHPDLVRRWELRSASAAAFSLDLEAFAAARSQEPRFAPFSAFPSSSRDLSLLVAEDLAYGELEACIRTAQIPDLARLELVDLFTGKGVPEGKKSLTLRLTFSRLDRTLRDAEVNAAVEKVLAELKKRLDAVLRT